MKLSRRLVWLLGAILVLGGLSSTPARAASVNAYYKALVLETQPGSLVIEMLDGPHRQARVTAGTTGLNSYADITRPTYHPGDTVVVYEGGTSGDSVTYSVVDTYRLSSLWWWLAVLVGLAVVFARWRGLGALLGLGVSAGIVGVIGRGIRLSN